MAPGLLLPASAHVKPDHIPVLRLNLLRLVEPLAGRDDPMPNDACRLHLARWPGMTLDQASAMHVT